MALCVRIDAVAPRIMDIVLVVPMSKVRLPIDKAGIVT